MLSLKQSSPGFGRVLALSSVIGALSVFTSAAAALERASPETCAQFGRTGVSTSTAECPQGGGTQTWPGPRGDKPKCRNIFVNQRCSTGTCKVVKRVCD